MGIASYQHTFSSDAVADVRAMVRDNANDFYSNPDSTPIEVFPAQLVSRRIFQGHGHRSTTAAMNGRSGVESDNIFLHENFSYIITDPNAIRSEHAPHLSLSRRIARTSSNPRFVQDLIRLGNWTINAGLRWDHYQLLLNRQAVDPRFSISRYFPSADLVLHFSYDRVFQTPSFENILLSSSTAARPWTRSPCNCRSSLRRETTTRWA